MIYLLYAAAALCAYLVSGLNPAIILSNAIYKKDIRTCGSKNPGFTNFRRAFGYKWAWWVLALDLTKSAVVVALFAFLFYKAGLDFSAGAAFTGLFAILGHAYPLWYGFKGGKGFLAYLSCVFIIDWRAGIIATAIMLILLFSTRYMSLATVAGMLSCPLTLVIAGSDLQTLILCSTGVLFMVWRHRENIIRLFHGTETKFVVKSKSAE